MSIGIFDYNDSNGLVLCKKPYEAQNNAERLYISEVVKLRAEAVLFRRYYSSEDSTHPKKSEPAVVIFKDKDYSFNSKEHKKLHAAIWSAGKNEVYMILGKTNLMVINARKPAAVVGRELDLKTLRLANIAIKDYSDLRFSAYLFGNGTFWEQSELENKIDEKDSPYLKLLDYLLAVRKELQKTNTLNLESGTIDKLLIVCILVKFLEEIKDDNGKHTLLEIYKKSQVNNFAEAVEKGFVVSVLSALASKFNGRIFDRFSEEEIEKIRETDLTLLSLFLRGDIDLNTKQLFLWEQYNFQHLPAEVISAIYENFIQADAERKNGKIEKGVVYTPIHLVNFLVDEMMPLDEPELFKDKNFKILDPSCGSGVFLVAAYKRLLQWWAINNSTTNNINYPNKDVAQKILENNIYGVDVKETAILVSILGLTSAFLNKLTPKEIWNNLRFKDLTEDNLLHDNFFNCAKDYKEKSFEFTLVLGNPPFNIESGKKKEEVLNAKTLTTLGLKHNKIPKNNFALHFLEGAMTITKKACLILPANVLLHDKKAFKYRKSLFSDFTVNNIFDFTHLRRGLFHKSADTAVVALCLSNKQSDSQSINHIVVKREILSEKRIRFEIDDYDINKVPFNYAISEEKQFIWKTNLLGGGRLFNLIDRLKQNENFKEFINQKKIENDEWTYSVGYKLKGAKRKHNIDYIFGKNTIVTETFDEHEQFETFVEENKSFSEPRNPKIYEPPHLIFKVNIGGTHIPIHYSDKYLCFKDKLVGIHAPVSEKELLIKIYNQFKNENYSKFCKFWILSTSSESLINLETACKKEDIDSLPFTLSSGKLEMNKFEEILQMDVLNFYIHLGKSIGVRGAGSVLHHKVNAIQLNNFGDVFCNSLNSIYKKNNKSWQAGRIYQNSSFVIYEFGFGEDGKIKHGFLSFDDESEIKQLVVDELSNKGNIYKRVVRFYQHVDGFDCIYLIKPLALRYWLKSIALRDADYTFIDLKNEGY